MYKERRNEECSKKVTRRSDAVRKESDWEVKKKKSKKKAQGSFSRLRAVDVISLIFPFRSNQKKKEF